MQFCRWSNSAVSERAGEEVSDDRMPGEFSFPAAAEAKFVRSRTRRKKDPLLDYPQRGQNIGRVKSVEDIR